MNKYKYGNNINNNVVVSHIHIYTHYKAICIKMKLIN